MTELEFAEIYLATCNFTFGAYNQWRNNKVKGIANERRCKQQEKTYCNYRSQP